MSEQEELQKKVQEKLAQCAKLLDECTELADQGGFQFEFDFPGSTYYPKSMFSREEVLEQLKEDMSAEDFDELQGQDLEDAIDEVRQEMIYEELPEYAEPGQWWMPSRIC